MEKKISQVREISSNCSRLFCIPYRYYLHIVFFFSCLKSVQQLKRRAFFKKLLVGSINKWEEFEGVSGGPTPENFLNFWVSLTWFSAFWRILTENPFQWSKFVQKRSLLSSEHVCFANIYTQRGLSLGVRKAVTGEAEGGNGKGELLPPRYIVKKGPALPAGCKV